MRPSAAVAVLCVGGALAGARPAPGQDWTTGGYDAQRSSWVRADAKISPERVRASGFQILWKVKVTLDSGPSSALTPPVLLDLVIGHRGFRSLGFVGGRADRVFTVDSDLGAREWDRQFASRAPSRGRSEACPGELTPNIARPTNAAFPALVEGRGGGGRAGQAARSAVGDPGQGAVTLAQLGARRRDAPSAPPKAPVPHVTPRPFPVVYVLSSDGMLHTLNVMNGADAEAPVPFLPPQAGARGLIVVDDVAYVATLSSCGEAPDGMWGLELGSKQVATWRSAGAIAGSVGPAIGPDGTVYVATITGELVALEPRTLKPKEVHRAGGTAFTSSPVVFEHAGSVLIAASARDGRIHLLDSHDLAKSRAVAYPNSAGVAADALASWADPDGTRWLLAASAGPVPGDAGFAVVNGAVPHGAIVAWQVVGHDGVPTLQPGWVSRDMITPLTPIVINGVVFALSSGELRAVDHPDADAQRAQRSSPAVLYALDGTTGKELWNSGLTIASFARGGLSGGGGQVYVGSNDGTLYAFGFPMEH
jgi:outer membrane protein assembly factor BamB